MISALIIYLYQRGLECKAVETHKPQSIIEEVLEGCKKLLVFSVPLGNLFPCFSADYES